MNGATGVASCAIGNEATFADGIEHGFRHDAACGIAGAQEKHVVGLFSLICSHVDPLGRGVNQRGKSGSFFGVAAHADRRSEEHTSELQSLMRISSAVFCLKKKKHNQ